MRALLAHRPRDLTGARHRGAVQPLHRRAVGGRRRTGGRVIPEDATLPATTDPGEPRPLVSPLEVIAIGTIIAVDQITKFLVRSAIPLYSKQVIIPNLLDITHVQNTGAAFGVMNAADFPYKSAVMIGIAALAAPVFCTCVMSSRFGMMTCL